MILTRLKERYVVQKEAYFIYEEAVLFYQTYVKVESVCLETHDDPVSRSSHRF